MAKMLGVLALLIGVVFLTFFGLTSANTLIESGDAQIDNSSSVYQAYDTTKQVTVTSYSFTGYLPYAIGLVLVITMLLSVAFVVGR